MSWLMNQVRKSIREKPSDTDQAPSYYTVVHGVKLASQYILLNNDTSSNSLESTLDFVARLRIEEAVFGEFLPIIRDLEMKIKSGIFQFDVAQSLLEDLSRLKKIMFSVSNTEETSNGG